MMLYLTLKSLEFNFCPKKNKNYDSLIWFGFGLALTVCVEFNLLNMLHL